MLPVPSPLTCSLNRAVTVVVRAMLVAFGPGPRNRTVGAVTSPVWVVKVHEVHGSGLPARSVTRPEIPTR